MARRRAPIPDPPIPPGTQRNPRTGTTHGGDLDTNDLDEGPGTERGGIGANDGECAAQVCDMALHVCGKLDVGACARDKECSSQVCDPNGGACAQSGCTADADCTSGVCGPECHAHVLDLGAPHPG